MGIQVAVEHRTRYHYERPLALGPQVIQLRPAPHCRTPILDYSLHITPPDGRVYWQFDPLTNQVARVIFPNKTDEFMVEVRLTADLSPVNPFDFVLEPGCETMPFAYSPETARNLEPFLKRERTGPHFAAFAASLSTRGQGTVSFLTGLNARLRDKIAYTTRLEHGVQSCEETLERRSGSCRDSSWLLVEVCRHLGLAARFVSGYLIQLHDAADSTSAAADSADLHAWAEVYLPGAGWIGLDPTSGLLTAEGHIPLACSSTPAGAAPISGTVEPAGVDFSYSITLRRLGSPQPAEVANKAEIAQKPELSLNLEEPYSDATWEQVRAVAHQVDRDLAAEDVRLTMGGEPTFVGIDEPESAQWSVEAWGELKRSLGLGVIRSLRARTAPGALLHLGQGKWYPGEPLPRWAFHCVSRMDGVPVWADGDLLALPDRQYGFGTADAQAFLEALARRLGATPDNILPVYEPGYEDPAAEPAGYILPLRRRQANGIAGKLAWSSQLWFPRPSRFELAPGDSPIGFRIPVELMPFVAPDTLVYEYEPELDSTTPSTRAVLASAPARHPERFAQTPLPDPLPAIPADAADAPELIRPSLCVQPREGRMHVFLPYVSVLADALDLVAAVEETAQHLSMPVWVEGYPPPQDPRARFFSLTPDPGVLEVNLPPTSAWDDLEALNAMLAEEAHKHRLIPSKFGYDGSHLSTGGGSHVTLGGPSVAESPILRRPALLRSMITFWQNHPSLSYLFSGMYVGPTSQYPRVDEARVDALYELELAFGHLPPEDCPPWIVDGLFRNLLVDVTGNSHRAEFCIDKLYPPEGRGLRLGLLELRAFEMAPHFRMGLLQMLLVRVLACTFWRQPFRGELLRWGATLHDRFMLPYFVERDFREVLAHLRRAGYAFEDAWFAPHIEFRFPRIGVLQAEGLELELRQALEPWNVLAEETTGGGTGRSVDSSLERLQVRVTGLAGREARFVVACNGRKVPLTPTGHPGEAVAGIRYRARRLSAVLHPTIPVHTPLTFELIDLEKSSSIGSCTYHAGPPDGSIHNTRPADAAEAGTRRLERFVLSAPASAPLTIPQDEANPVFPMTLDMRWPAPAERSQAL